MTTSAETDRERSEVSRGGEQSERGDRRGRRWARRKEKGRTSRLDVKFRLVELVDELGERGEVAVHCARPQKQISICSSAGRERRWRKGKAAHS